MKVVVLLPTYNEKGNIEKLIREIQEVASKLPFYQFDLLVVDDSSPDGTALVIKDLKNKYHNLFLLLNKEKVGLGRALVIGMDYAIKKLGADIIVQMDADLSHDPKKIPEFLKKIEEGADFVVGSRYVKGGSIPKRWGLHRKIFSRVGNLIVRTLLGIFWIHEWTSGFRAIKKNFFEKAKNELQNVSGYTFQVAFLHKSLKNGAKIAEVPITFSERYYGRSKLTPMEYITNLLRYLITARTKELWESGFLKFFIVGTIGFVINALGLEIFYKFGLRPGPAASLGAEMAIISNFTLNNFWTFKDQKVSKITTLIAKFVQFNFTSIGAVIIQGIVVGLGTNFFGDQYRMIFMAGAVIFLVVPYSWFIYSRVIWKKTNH